MAGNPMIDDPTKLLNFEELSQDHAAALKWFQDHRGQSIPWTSIVNFAGQEGGARLVTQAKGIYKPQGNEYALSVRQTLDSPYADKDVEYRADGTWVYPYFQENPDPSQRDNEFTNRGLVRCMQDGVPVGALLQVKPKPGVEYQVLGLAQVVNWLNGYFILEGLAPDGSLGSSRAGRPDAARDRALATALAPTSDGFEPFSIEDLRRRSLEQVVQRRGQARFRAALIEAYHGQCAISECDAVEALEAAHIAPYRGDQSDHPQNGLLLRADLHSLFDLGLIAINTNGMKVVVAPKLRRSIYGTIAGQDVRLPENEVARPSISALDAHRAWAGL
jgi:hypothetical protein